MPALSNLPGLLTHRGQRAVDSLNFLSLLREIDFSLQFSQ